MSHFNFTSVYEQTSEMNSAMNWEVSFVIFPGDLFSVGQTKQLSTQTDVWTTIKSNHNTKNWGFS